MVSFDPVRPRLARRPIDATLLGSVSILALMIGAMPGEAANRFGTNGPVAPAVAAQAAAAAAAQQATAAASQAQASLARAAASLSAAQGLQSAAAAAAAIAGSSVPNGLTTGGLVPTDPTSTNLWFGAQAPVQTVNGSQVTVGIQQTQPKAILYWNSFNIGANTTVDFQQASNSYIALNRVNNSTAPSQIFGKINALGGVYIINSNGIIFGAGSQVNVNTLIASSLDIGQLGSPLASTTSTQGRDDYFKNLGDATPSKTSFSFYDWATQGSATSTAVAGDITVQRGAQINANVGSTASAQGTYGDIYLFGANVYNSGLLNAPTGEVGMVAARTIELIPNGYFALPTTVLGTNSQGTLQTFRGTQFKISQFAADYDPSSGYPTANGSTYLPGTGTVRHDGLIEAPDGVVIMNGDNVVIDNPRDANGNPLTDPTTGALVQGVISANTSIDRNSFVMLQAATSVTMNGVITALPYDDGSSALPTGGSSGSTVQSFTPPYIEMTAQRNVTLGPSALVSAPSAVVTLRAVNLGNPALYEPTQTGSLFTEGSNLFTAADPSSPAQNVLLSPGAVIDVAGLENVMLPAGYNVISFQPRAEFANMPIQRDGPLYGQTLYININDSGTNSDGTTWVGTPLADASGYVSAVGRSIYQLMTTGGSVSLQTDIVNGSQVKTAGSVINVAGGSEQFQAGMVPTTILLGADGRLYSMADANPNIPYVGIANQFTVNHSRWGISETWTSQIYSPGYSQGEAAGSVSVTTLNALLQGGTMYFGSVAGQLQLAEGQLPSQGSFTLISPTSVEIGSSASADYTTQAASVTNLSADTFSGYGLSSLSITADDVVVSKGSTLNLAPGGSFSVLAGGAIDIAGTVSAAGGSVSLTTDRVGVANISALGFNNFFSNTNVPTDSAGQQIAANIYVEGTIDVSGRFVNDTGLGPTDISGPADINGGKITIATSIASNNGAQDWTGSILLAPGSLLDASSGGYISPQGQPKTVATNVMAGQGGSIALSIYQASAGALGTGFDALSPPDDLTFPTSGPVASIKLDGSLRAYGFQSNGSLTIGGVDNVQIGGSLAAGATSNIIVGGAPSPIPVSLLTSGGFGSYSINSVPDQWTGAAGTVTVAAGVNLTLQQQNLASLADYSQVGTGTELGQQASPVLATLPADQRQPVNLTLGAANVLLDTGSTIVTDPGASITLGGVTVNLNLSQPDPSVTRLLPAPSVTLLGSITDHGGSVFINTVTTELGPQALVDLSGTFVPSSTFGWRSGGSQVSGNYLPGGTFTVESGAPVSVQQGASTATFYGPPSGPTDAAPNAPPGVLVAESGSVVDVSGAAGDIQVEGPHGITSVWSWSNAGTVSADVLGFAWGGNFIAMGGRYIGADGKTYADSRANNGTLVLSGGAITLSQDITAFASVLTNYQQQGALPQSIYVAANQLTGFDDVYLYAGSAEGGADRVFTDMNGDIYGLPVNQQGQKIPGAPTFAALNIQGSVDLSVANRLHIAASGIDASPGNSINVELTAPYVEMTGGGGGAGKGSSTLTIAAQNIDVEGAAFSGFSQVNLISSGDLRLGTLKVADGTLLPGTSTSVDASSFTGSLVSAGNLLLSAQRIYPISDVTFTIQTTGNVDFTAPAGSNTSIPLAAGGGITVLAGTVDPVTGKPTGTIDQGGNLFAPLGQIMLGNSSITQSVTLEPGSLTSVTLADTVVPFGATQDDGSWYYNASLNPLTAAPSKGVVLSGANVNVTQGSTIDLRGGGDLQAMEWISGKGGTVDTLETTSNGPTVYALVPSASAPIAAYDIQFATSRSPDSGQTEIAGDVNPMVGTQITIAGGGGIPAGTYTLYPAHYATLPGAMKVVDHGSNLGKNLASGTTLSDGTVLVTGNYTQSTNPGRQSTGQELFAVQTNAVWQSYSQYQFTSGNTYFRSLAIKNGTLIPVPVDAGSLQVIATQTINLGGSFLANPGLDSSGNVGNGGELDVSSPQAIDIVGHTQYVTGDVPAGYVAVDVSQLDNSGFESILVGGVRSATVPGLITPSSSSILVDTRGEAFSAPEILLVATPAVTASSLPGSDPNSGTVTIDPGSVINTTGTLNEAPGRSYYIAASSGTVTAQSVATALGGTLDSTGTIITGANGTISGAAAAVLAAYQKQSGALFVATNDSTLTVSGSTAPPLTIQFAPGGANTGSVTVADGGRVTIGSGSSITTKALTLLATASTNAIAINTTDLHVGQMNLAARTIALGASAPANDFSLALYSSEFTGIGGLALKALSGAITVYGDYNPGASASNLTLDAAAVVQAPGTTDANISASGTITLRNSGTAVNPTSPLATPQTTLSLNAEQIVLGSATQAGAQTILGYANVDLNASERVVIAGPGSLTLGYDQNNSDGTFTFVDAVNLNIATPHVLVSGASGANGKSFALSTGGSASIMDTVPQVGWGAQPTDSPDVGGNLAITASDISVGTVIQAQAGTISLEATKGDVTLLPRAGLFAGGYAQTLVDVTSYIAGGKISLQADAGNVNVGAFSIIDVAQPANGLGYGGEVDIIAQNGNATISGLLLGSGGPGHGGAFDLDTKGAVDLGHYVISDGNGNQSIAYQIQPLQPGQTETYVGGLADQLGFGGFTGSVNIHTQTGNIVLAEGRTLKASSIMLTADDPTWDANNPAWDPANPNQLGQVQIYGTLDASGYSGTTLDGVGEAGGQVALYGANAVLLASTGVIDASTTHADQRGGDVTVGIGWSAQAKIYLQAFTKIDVSGGTQGGLSGGTVTFVAPNDGNNDMKIAALYPGTNIEMPTIGGQLGNRNSINIIGARSVTFDSYVSFDTTASGSKYGIDAAGLGWNGIVDPAGWFNPDGTLATSGTWNDVAGWVISGLPTTLFRSAPNVTSIGGGTAFAVDMGVYWPSAGLPFTQQVQNGNVTLNYSFGSPVTIPVGQSGTITFVGAVTGGTVATGTWSTTPNGLSITIQNHGTGYLQAPTSMTLQVGGTTTTYSVSLRAGIGLTATLGVNSLTVRSIGSGYSESPSSPPPSTLAVRLSDSFGTSATFNLAQGFGSGAYSDQNGNVSFTPSQNNFIPFTSSGVFSPFNPATQNTPGVASFTGNTQDQAFFDTTLAQYTQGNWSYNGQNYGFGNLFTRLQPLVNQLGASVVQVQPGVQLVNSRGDVNGGDITVANNWNLASGTAGNLQTATNPVTNTSFQYFDGASSYVNFNYRLLTPWGNLDAGNLTLRASGNINIDASISDGFYQTANYLDPTYVAWVASYINADRSFSNNYTYYLNGYSATNAVPVAPYDPFGNVISPSSQDLAAADLFPNALNVCTSACGTSSPNLIQVTAPLSWSYTLNAGANLNSANPTSRISLSTANAANKGDVILANHGSYDQSLIGAASPQQVNLPTMVRTGTGDITVAAARDVVMQDTTAPGVIYAAGVNVPLLPGANYSGSSTVVAGNPDGFLEPQVLAYGNGGTANGTFYYGPPTAAAFPEMGGDVQVDAQRDVIGYDGSGNKVPQYYQPWLLADADLTPAQNQEAGLAASQFGAGVFAPSGSSIASQTAWWIQYSSFQQGILSAGGNVTVVAGRDLIDVSVSLPTTGRVSGGLSAGSTPMTYDYGSGNMVVRAGGNILGGSFYEGSGEATIFARGTIGQNGTVAKSSTSAVTLPDLPLLAVDTGQIEMVSLGSLSVAGVTNPAMLQTQSPSFENPLETPGTAQPFKNLYFDTYGPESGVQLVAVTGDLTISIAPTAIQQNSLTAAPATYPASLEAMALNGNLVTTGIQVTATASRSLSSPFTIAAPGIVLSPSDHGEFELLAEKSVDLTFGYPDDRSLIVRSPRPYISAGSSLIDTGFDPFQPNSGFDGSSSAALLAHADDAQAGIDATARIYAVTGSITAAGSYGQNPETPSSTNYQNIQFNRPAEIYAGADIVDLNAIIQNIHPSDISTITAGRNITYTGFSNGGGIQVAGPGFLVVQAGGDIGPFLPSNVDTSTLAPVQEGIASVGNASATPVGDIYLSQSSVGIYDQALFGSITTPRRNSQLTDAAGTSQGASLIVQFGVKTAPDYQAMISAYINPSIAGSTSNYEFNVQGLDAYLAQLGYSTNNPQISQKIAAAIQQLTPAQRTTFFNSLQALLTQFGFAATDNQFTLLAEFVSVLNKTPSDGLLFQLLTFGQQTLYINDVVTSQNYLLSPGTNVSFDPQTSWAVFQQLPQNLQKVLVDQVFFAELKRVGEADPTATSCPQVCQPAWNAIHTLFPTGQMVDGDQLNLLHATIQTRLGGSVSIMGPGGGIAAGTLGQEPNANLKLRDLGILTLGGGDINTYTDGSVLVNSSRVLTTQGGDVLMWSSFGDLNAGQGSKTIVSAPAIQALFDQNDYETIDPGGYVTGSGIGTLQASRNTPPGNLYLVAPNGTIDFGTAGVRASGNAVFVAPVISNASNFVVSGTATGVPTIPSLSASVAQSANTSQTKPTVDPTAAGTANDQASVFIVEVIGYGDGGRDSDPQSTGQ